MRRHVRRLRLISCKHAFIELWRGVPLLTVLFMAAVLLPLFLPNGVAVDRLVRTMGALVPFNAAYMAEVVRGGLQGVDAEQEEAVQSLGLAPEGYAFAAVTFFICCLAMSAYGRSFERRLARGQGRAA